MCKLNIFINFVIKIKNILDIPKGYWFGIDMNMKVSFEIILGISGTTKILSEDTVNTQYQKFIDI